MERVCVSEGRRERGKRPNNNSRDMVSHRVNESNEEGLVAAYDTSKRCPDKAR